jgi:hypothetical protein
MARRASSGSKSSNSSANLGIEAKLWLAADKLSVEHGCGRIQLRRPQVQLRTFATLRDPAAAGVPDLLSVEFHEKMTPASSN